MKKGEKIKIIDQSIKLYSWATKQPNPQQYSQVNQLPNPSKDSQRSNHSEQFQPPKPLQSQLDGLQTGFLKLKNEQIEKLRDLRSEYEEIKKITNDYTIPQDSRPSSIASSSPESSEKSPYFSPASPKFGKKKMPVTREVQILMLQKRQMEGMLENSLKKIDELLHNEMQFKKIIHELKLERDSRKFDENQHLYTSQFVRKKQKDYDQQIRQLQLERQSFIAVINSTKDRVQFLEAHLANSQKQLSALIDQKRNFQEILRIEKDKYLNLQLECRRNKRQYEIFEKDKNAQVNQLIKLKEVKEGTALIELKNVVLLLQEEIKIIQHRYRLLLEQLQKCQKDKQKKEIQAKLIDDFIDKASHDPQSKVIQETITSILQRVHQLENRPISQIEELQKIAEHQHQIKSENATLKQQNQKLQMLIEQKTEENQKLFNQSCRLKVVLQKTERKIAILEQNQQDLLSQVQKLKSYQRSIKREKSVNELKSLCSSPYLQARPQSNLEQFQLKEKRKFLDTQNQSLKTGLATLQSEKQSLQKQNRDLRLQVLRLKFQLQKTLKQAQLSSSLLTKTHQSQIASLTQQIEQLKIQLISKPVQQSPQSMRIIQQKNSEIQKWKQTVQILQKKLSALDLILRSNQKPQLTRTKSQQFKQLSELMSTVQTLTLRNEQHLKQKDGYQKFQQQNDKLKQLLRKSQSATMKLNELWQTKQLQYQKINQLIKPLLSKGLDQSNEFNLLVFYAQTDKHNNCRTSFINTKYILQ